MMSSTMQLCPGSFRDSAGQVFFSHGRVLRTIHKNFSHSWHACVESGFLQHAVEQGLLLPFKEVEAVAGAWKTLESPLLPFVSYPYEWSFGQLKAAALHTLDVLDAALAHGLILRDATAYNIQFIGSKPVFIDFLSFEPWQKGRPWKAYGQFCRHFLAPLAMMALRAPECGKLLLNWLDGLPLSLVAQLLPSRTRLMPTLALHIHMHAKLENKYADARTATKKLKQTSFSENTVPNLSQALRLAVEKLHLPHSLHTQWGDYYTDTNYTEAAARDKKTWIETAVGNIAGEKSLAIDVGANTAVYSQFLASVYKQVLAVDVDYLAIEKLYAQLAQQENKNILPLVIDFCNPPAAIGWNNEERLSFLERCQADYVSALALVHHLRFTGGIPLPQIVRCLAGICKKGGILVFEFVPMEDSQVQRMLAARSDETFSDYTMESCLSAIEPYFTVLEQHPVAESVRTLFLLQKN